MSRYVYIILFASWQPKISKGWGWERKNVGGFVVGGGLGVLSLCNAIGFG